MAKKKSNKNGSKAGSTAAAKTSEPEVDNSVDKLKDSVESTTLEPTESGPEPESDHNEAKKEPEQPETSPETEPKTEEKSEVSNETTKQANGDSKASNYEQIIAELRSQLETVETERDDIQDEYDELLEKVGQIKESVSARFKSHDEEMTKVKEEVSTIKEEKQELLLTTERLKRQLAEAKGEHESRQIQWQAEKAQLQKEIQEKLSFEHALAEEKALRDALESQLSQVQEDLASQTSFAEHYKSAASSAEQKHSQDTVKWHDRLDTLAKNNEALTIQLETAKSQKQAQDEEIASLKKDITQVEAQASDVAGLQDQIKEKNIVIGKLRHEAVILNEHLTNALRMVKKDAEGNTVDKELISNLIVQFAVIPGRDTKKFEVLQLLSNFLGWDEDRQVQVGLTRGSGQIAAASGNPESLGGFFGKFAEFLERESNRKR